MTPSPSNLDYAGAAVSRPRTPPAAWWSLGLGIAIAVLWGGALLLLVQVDRRGGSISGLIGAIFAVLVWILAVLGGALGIVHGVEALRTPRCRRGVASEGLAICTAIETLALGTAAILFGFI